MIASEFAHVRAWVFDLDNTLYPPSMRLFDQIELRMAAYVSAAGTSKHLQLTFADAAHEPEWFTTAPPLAANKALTRAGLSAKDVDYWEVNEAFAVVPMAAERELGIARETLNIHGGACALGHPIGASGARILVTLVNALETHGKKRGVAAICIGGGEGTAIAVELP